jgi:hypothetical protein
LTDEIEKLYYHQPSVLETAADLVTGNNKQARPCSLLPVTKWEQSAMKQKAARFAKNLLLYAIGVAIVFFCKLTGL